MQRLSVSDVMTRDVMTVREDDGYKDIVGTLVRRGVDAAPVLDQQGRVLGVVAAADLLHKAEFVGVSSGLLGRHQARLARVKASARVARELMTAPAVTTRATTALSEAAALLESTGLNLLPVVDDAGCLLGTLSPVDLLRIYLVDDAALRDEIVQRILVAILDQDAAAVVVEVERGIVTLSGTVDRRSTANLIVQLVETVAGVVNVCDLTESGYDDVFDLWCRQPVAARATAAMR